MVLKHFILPEMHFKAKLFFFFIMTPLTHPTTPSRDYQGGNTKRGEWGLIKVKKLGDILQEREGAIFSHVLNNF